MSCLLLAYSKREDAVPFNVYTFIDAIFLFQNLVFRVDEFLNSTLKFQLAMYMTAIAISSLFRLS